MSIAMATFNGAQYLQEQLDSFASQRRLPDELVVCDDGSTDDTLEILQRFAASAAFEVQIHRNEHSLGYIANFGKALALTSGDLVFLSDQDDVWFPTKLALFEERANSDPSALLLVCDAILSDSALKPGVRYTENQSLLGAGPEQLVVGCCTAIRREFLALALPILGDNLPHDVWLHLLAGATGRRVYLDSPQQFYRRHGANVSSNITHALFGHSAAFRLRYYLKMFAHDPAPYWLERLEHVRLARTRLSERFRALEELIGSASATNTIRELDAEMEEFRTRIRIVQLARRRRLGTVLTHYRGDGYARYSGLLSAAKDLVRPKSPIAGSRVSEVAPGVHAIGGGIASI